jgi:hypothetical protein
MKRHNRSTIMAFLFGAGQPPIRFIAERILDARETPDDVETLKAYVNMRMKFGLRCVDPDQEAHNLMCVRPLPCTNE